MKPNHSPRIAILGAGPTGLEAALAANEAGMPFTLYEAADAVAGHVRSWGHVRLFTPWEMNVSARMAHHLGAAGVRVPEGGHCPDGQELIEQLLLPLARLPEIAPRLEVNARVVSIGREGLLKHEEIGTDSRAGRRFRLLVAHPDGSERVAHADVVLDCTGTYGHPCATGDGGVPAVGERAMGREIVRAIPNLPASEAGGDEQEWAGKRVLVVGAGHSAQTAVRALAALARRAPGTHVLWALRREGTEWAAAPDDPLPERARLAADAGELASGASPAVEPRTGVVVEELRPGAAFLRGRDGGVERVEVDRVLSLTGSVGDHSLYRQLQVHECYATSGPMKLAAALLGESSADCLAQSGHGPDTLRNPEPNFFILGSKSYGRNNTFLMRIGWQQVNDVFGMLA